MTIIWWKLFGELDSACRGNDGSEADLCTVLRHRPEGLPVAWDRVDEYVKTLALCVGGIEQLRWQLLIFIINMS